MVNYSTKVINIVSICVSIILTVILIILLDLLILPKNRIHNELATINKYTINKNLTNSYNERRNLNAIKLDDVMLATMQIADIYENTVINNTENNTENNIEDNISKEQIYTSNLQSSWRIEIPKIGVIAPIKEGTTQEILGTAVGHFPGTNTYRGNVSLAGHNRGYNCNFFARIKELKEGDKIIYYTDKGKREYEVVLNKIIHQTDWTYIEDTSDNRLTLITCVENMFEYRRCVQAVEI